MISLCLEYVEKRAEKIFIYCSCEGRSLAVNFFFQINGKIVHKHQLNEARRFLQKKYNFSRERESQALRILASDLDRLEKLCRDHERDVPTQIKLIYDVAKGSVSSDYSYDLIWYNSPDKIPGDVFIEWFEEVKRQKK